MLIDLHIHTNESDGTYSPESAVRTAKEYGIKAIAITDHDSIDGIKPAIAEGKAIGIQVVPGIEINTEYGDVDIHILGYYMDINDKRFLDLLRFLREERIKRIERFIEKLKAIGFDVELERVLQIAGKGSIGRPHLGRVLMEQGYVGSMREAFEKYLDRGSPTYVERHEFPPTKAIEAIRQARGIPVIAHPGILKKDDIIPELVKDGLMGIEVFHSEHTWRDRQNYMLIAKETGLLMTGGSDCHGPGGKDRMRIGTVRVPYVFLERLEEAKANIDRINY